MSAFALSEIHIADPINYYDGFDLPRRPVSRNVLIFLRNSRQTLQQKNVTNRMHHRHVLILALKTAGLVSVEAKNLWLEAGQALLVLPYQFHHFIQLECDDLRWLFVTFELEQGASSLINLKHRPLSPDERYLRIWAEMVEQWSCGDAEAQAEVLPLLDQLLLRLTRLGGMRPTQSVSQAKKSVKDDWISKVESLVVRSVQEGWTLDEVAAKLGLSSRHLRNRFEAATGVSLSEYRREYQLNHAITLMQNSELSLGEIAEISGFNSQSAFNRFVKNKTGQTPRALRVVAS
jgi:AraC-like DNA-binding protein